VIWRFIGVACHAVRLRVHESGSGPKTAVLVHGLLADHRTWHAVTSHLAGRGYRVLAVDLRGHGRSPRGDYAAELFADDLVETLPCEADLAIGHSLGGLALLHAAERLRPRRVIYSDPSLQTDRPPPSQAHTLLSYVNEATVESIHADHPKWSSGDIEAELAGFALLDRACAAGIHEWWPVMPPAALRRAVVPSLIQIAAESAAGYAGLTGPILAAGFDVEIIPGTGHCIHRDDPAAFLDSVTRFASA
jgi:pimeloyl-ACP methyl ester carboxylesterase